MRLGVVQGEYHWHRHTRDQEFFYCVDGCLFVDIVDDNSYNETFIPAADPTKPPIQKQPTTFKEFKLEPRQGMVVPKNVVHRTRACVKTVIMMVENKDIIPTGN